MKDYTIEELKAMHNRFMELHDKFADGPISGNITQWSYEQLTYVVCKNDVCLELRKMCAFLLTYKLNVYDIDYAVNGH